MGAPYYTHALIISSVPASPAWCPPKTVFSRVPERHDQAGHAARPGQGEKIRVDVATHYQPRFGVRRMVALAHASFMRLRLPRARPVLRRSPLRNGGRAAGDRPEYFVGEKQSNRHPDPRGTLIARQPSLRTGERLRAWPTGVFDPAGSPPSAPSGELAQTRPRNHGSPADLSSTRPGEIAELHLRKTARCRPAIPPDRLRRLTHAQDVLLPRRLPGINR